MTRRTRTLSWLLGGILQVLLAPCLPAAPPANDGLADAEKAAGPWGRARGSNVLATFEPGEPGHAGEGGGRSVWWTWSPPGAGLATIHTFGSGFDTLLAVYVGDSIPSLVEIAASDDVNDVAFHSLVTFNATAGVAYRIAVDGFEGAQGEVALAWHLDTSGGAAPPNDAFSLRQSLAADEGVTAASNRNAGLEAGEPAHAGDAGGKSLWWSLAPAISGTATLHTDGSGFDTVLAVYIGEDVAALTPVTADDNGAGGLASWVRFAVSAGQEYQIAVDGRGAASGPIFLSWSLSPACPLPRPPARPSPPDGAEGAGTVPILIWEDEPPAGGGAGPAGPGGGGVVYDVHFGRCGDVDLAATTAEAVWSPGQLEPGARYCWQVIARDECGSTPGPLWSFTTAPLPAASFQRGDATEDGSLNVTDAIAVLNFLFLGEAPPSCPKAGDLDDSGTLNVTDPVYLLNFLFSSGPPPAEPHGECGFDATEDLLGCEGRSFCE
jgi:hypothetical protein